MNGIILGENGGKTIMPFVTKCCVDKKRDTEGRILSVQVPYCIAMTKVVVDNTK